jgi:hypothetical protein
VIIEKDRRGTLTGGSQMPDVKREIGIANKLGFWIRME